MGMLVPTSYYHIEKPTFWSSLAAGWKSHLLNDFKRLLVCISQF